MTKPKRPLFYSVPYTPITEIFMEKAEMAEEGAMFIELLLIAEFLEEQGGLL